MASNAGLTTLLIIGGSVGAYFVYRHFKSDRHLGHGATRGYFTGSPPVPPDPRNCLCPMDLDPLNAALPSYHCPCNVPGAVRPPFAGYMAVGRGGGGGGHFHHQQQQQQQQQDDGSGGGGGPPDPYGQPPMPPQPPPPPYHPHHYGRRR